MRKTLERKMPLSDRVRELRLNTGFSQEALARKAGITVSALRKIEQGSVPNPQWLTIRAIATALGASLDDLSANQDLPPAKNVGVVNRKKRGPTKP
jgi:transcriptional regulator with XRE-family HTH domain